MDIDFQCTQCGNCCKELRLPLSVNEALGWLRDGNPVQVLCEAIPWSEEPPSTNPFAPYKRERSFAAISDQLPIRVLVTLAAPLGQGCPNLGEDNLCTAYGRRPSVCRTYPAELNPFLELATGRRRCPPEAWRDGANPLLRASHYVDGELRLLIQSTEAQAVHDVPAKEALCGVLGIKVAAMANEGYVAHSPGKEQLLAALLASRAPAAPPAQDWVFMSDRTETVEAILSCDAHCLHADGDKTDGVEYLSLFAI